MTTERLIRTGISPCLPTPTWSARRWTRLAPPSVGLTVPHDRQCRPGFTKRRNSSPALSGHLKCSRPVIQASASNCWVGSHHAGGVSPWFDEDDVFCAEGCHQCCQTLPEVHIPRLFQRTVRGIAATAFFFFLTATAPVLASAEKRPCLGSIITATAAVSASPTSVVSGSAAGVDVAAPPSPVSHGVEPSHKQQKGIIALERALSRPSTDLRSETWPEAVWGQIEYMVNVFLFENSAFSKAVILALMTLLLTGIGGAAYYFTAPPEESRKKDIFSEIWTAWSIIVDPGRHTYEESIRRRYIGVPLSIGGLLFFSVVVGVASEAIFTRIQNLERGNFQVRESGHVLILGWTPKTVHVVRQLVLAHRDSGGSRIVVLGHKEKSFMDHAIRSAIPDTMNSRILTRMGNPLLAEHLRKVSAMKASKVVVMLLMESSSQLHLADCKVVETCQMLDQLEYAHGHKPVIIAEFSDAENFDLLLSPCLRHRSYLYGGDSSTNGTASKPGQALFRTPGSKGLTTATSAGTGGPMMAGVAAHAGVYGSTPLGTSAAAIGSSFLCNLGQDVLWKGVGDNVLMVPRWGQNNLKVVMVSTGEFASKLLVQKVSSPDVATVLQELASFLQGNELCERERKDLVGVRFRDAVFRCGNVIPIGIHQRATGKYILVPSPELVIAPGDKIVAVGDNKVSFDIQLAQHKGEQQDRDTGPQPAAIVVDHRDFDWDAAWWMPNYKSYQVKQAMAAASLYYSSSSDGYGAPGGPIKADASSVRHEKWRLPNDVDELTSRHKRQPEKVLICGGWRRRVLSLVKHLEASLAPGSEVALLFPETHTRAVAGLELQNVRVVEYCGTHTSREELSRLPLEEFGTVLVVGTEDDREAVTSSMFISHLQSKRGFTGSRIIVEYSEVVPDSSFAVQMKWMDDYSMPEELRGMILAQLAKNEGLGCVVSSLVSGSSNVRFRVREMGSYLKHPNEALSFWDIMQRAQDNGDIVVAYRRIAATDHGGTCSNGNHGAAHGNHNSAYNNHGSIHNSLGSVGGGNGNGHVGTGNDHRMSTSVDLAAGDEILADQVVLNPADKNVKLEWSPYDKVIVMTSHT